MKKWMALVLTFCMLLTSAAAWAEEAQASFTPGRSVQQLLQAFEAGYMLKGNLSAHLDANVADMDLWGSNADLAYALQQALSGLVISGGFGKLEDGYRLELGAELAHATSDQMAEIWAALDVTKNGLALESDLIEGKRVSIQWETLLAMLEVPQEQIDQIMMLKQMDLKALKQMYMQMAQEWAELAAQLYAPYVLTVASHIAKLPTEEEANAPWDEHYPEAAKKTTVRFSQKHVGDLIAALCDQLMQDQNLLPMLEMAMQSGMLTLTNTGSQAASVAEWCAQLKADAQATLTSEALNYEVVTGKDAYGSTLFVGAAETMEDGTLLSVRCICDVDRFTLTAEQQEPSGEISCDLSLSVGYAENFYDPMLCDASVQFSLNAVDGSMLLLSFDAATSPLARYGQQAYAGDVSAEFLMLDEEWNLTDVSLQTLSSMFETADGGEEAHAYGSIRIEAEEQLVPVHFEQHMYAFDGEVAPEIIYTESVAVPQMGVYEAGYVSRVWAEKYDAAASAALEQIAVETAGEDVLETLLETAQEALYAREEAAYEILPEDVMDILSVNLW